MKPNQKHSLKKKTMKSIFFFPVTLPYNPPPKSTLPFICNRAFLTYSGSFQLVRAGSLIWANTLPPAEWESGA